MLLAPTDLYSHSTYSLKPGISLRTLLFNGGYGFPYTSGAGDSKGKADALHASLLIPLSCLPTTPSCSHQPAFLSFSDSGICLIVFSPSQVFPSSWMTSTSTRTPIHLPSLLVSGISGLPWPSPPPLRTTCSHIHLPIPVIISKITNSSISLPFNYSPYYCPLSSSGPLVHTGLSFPFCPSLIQHRFHSLLSW